MIRTGRGGNQLQGRKKRETGEAGSRRRNVKVNLVPLPVTSECKFDYLCVDLSTCRQRQSYCKKTNTGVAHLTVSLTHHLKTLLLLLCCSCTQLMDLDLNLV